MMAKKTEDGACPWNGEMLYSVSGRDKYVMFPTTYLFNLKIIFLKQKYN
jgi:hypothetical protein